MADDIAGAVAALQALPGQATPTPAPPPDPNALDPSLTFGVPTGAPAPPSLADIAASTTRLSLLQGTDTNSGAPVEVRAAVGAAPSDAARLATIRSFYPDATPLPGGGDNFVYTVPGTGTRRTYEPMGWRIPTMGDIASVGGQVAQGIGGTVGASLGAAGGPVGAAVGAGLGAGAGSEAWRLASQYLGTVDPRTATQKAVDLGNTIGLNAVLPTVGEKVLGPVFSLLRPGTGTPTQAAAQGLEAGGYTPGLTSTLPAGVAGESPAVQKLEAGVSALPFSGGVRQGYATTRDLLADAPSQIAAQAAGGAPVPPPATFASTVSNIADRITNNYRTQLQLADDEATRLIGGNTQVDLTELQTLRGQLASQMRAAQPGTPAGQAGPLSARFQPAIDRIDQILQAADPSSGTLGFEAVRNMRTDLGKDIADMGAPGIGQSASLPNLQAVYGALKDSLLDTASNAGPQAYAALAEHDGAVTRFNAPGGPADTMRALQDPTTRANAVTRMMQSSAPGDLMGLGNLTTWATAADRQQLAAGVIENLGLKPDGTFDPSTFLKNYGRTTQPARDMLFGPTTGPGGIQNDLNNLATVQGTMAGSAANKNFSNTAPVLTTIDALSDIFHGVVTGEPSQILAGAGRLGSSAAAGRLFTSRPFVQWLTGTYGVNPQVANAWANHLTRLGTVATADPALQNFVTGLRSKLPDQLPPDVPTQ